MAVGLFSVTGTNPTQADNTKTEKKNEDSDDDFSGI